MRVRSSIRSAIGIVGVLVLGACSGPEPSGSQPAAPLAVVPDALPLKAHVIHQDARAKMPRFAWLDSEETKGRLAGLAPSDVAWSSLRGIASAYGLPAAVLASAELESIHDAGVGPIVARFRQRVVGLEVFRAGMNLVLSRDLDPVAASGTLARLPREADRPAFQLSGSRAVAEAAKAFGARASEGDVAEEGALSGDYSRFVIARGALGERFELAPTRAKRVWFDGEKGLEPAWYVELHLGSDVVGESDLRSYVVSAIDGAILFTNSMTADASYRVYAESSGTRALFPYAGPQGNGGLPHPTGRPDGFQAPFVSANLVTLTNFPFSKNDPWLPAGATTTSGNNVEAFANLVAPDGFQAGDLRPAPTALDTFDFSFDHSKNPEANATNQQAATTQLFYITNFMHDWFYDAGWDEASYNPQKDNLGRGGVANDPIVAQAQDESGRNNANASTPADGASPRIRMYIFDGNAVKKITASGIAQGTSELVVNTTAFGPKAFLLSGSVVVAEAADACTPLTNAAAIAGKIALVDRGTCAAIIKTKNAQDAGALGVIIANNQPGAPPGFTSAPDVDPNTITIPTLTVTQDDGALIKRGVGAGNVDVTLRRDQAIDRDGALDAAIVSHEWGHILSNRLIGNGNGLVGQQARGMGEGWSDFVSLLTYTSAEHALAPSNADWSGVFGLAGYVESGGENDGYYYGIRRVPYSVDFTKDPLTFKHVENGVPLPSTAPFAYGQDGKNNAEVHATGEVWATMLWECYVALLRDSRYTFEQANERMRKYLVASLKATPVAPTIVEARDALLATAYATDRQDFDKFALAFARRGAGVGAESPPATSTTNTGAKESFVTGGDVAIVSAEISGTVSSCNPYGILRNGEAGKLTVKLKNTGTSPLLATQLTLASAGGITFPNGAVVNVPPIRPFQTASVVVDVGLAGASHAQTIDTTLDVTDPDLVVRRMVSLTYSADYNYEVGLGTSTSDAFDTPVSAWSPSSDAALDTTEPWAFVADGTKHRWSLPGTPSTADHSLVSPEFEVGAAPLSVTFDHRFAFESSRGKNFDAGVIEVTTDGGATWFDMGALVSPGYTGVVDFDRSTNPLKTRTAFTGQSAGYPAYVTATLNLGTAFAGQTIQLRFRAGTDEGTADVGWDIAKVSVQGLTNKPFPSRQPVPATCAPPAPTPAQPETGPIASLAPWLQNARKSTSRLASGLLDLLGF